MKIPEAIISDVDGTLLNTLHLIRHGQYEASKTYLTEQGIDVADIPTYEDYEIALQHSVGSSTRNTLEKTVRLLYEDKQHHLTNLNFDHLNDLLDPIQDKIAPDYIKAYDGLSRLFSHIGEVGIKFGLFTSGSPYHIARNFGIALPELGIQTLYQDRSLTGHEKLERFETAIQNYFHIPEFTVVTCEDISVQKPDPASLQMAMERLQVQPENTLMMGDHAVDIQAGVNAGVVERIGVTHGFDDEQILRDAGATQVLNSLDDVVAALKLAA